MRPERREEFVIISHNDLPDDQKNENKTEPLVVPTAQSKVTNWFRNIKDYTASCIPGSDRYIASVRGSPYSYSEEKHKSATFILGTQSFGIGCLLNDIQHSHNKKGFYDNTSDEVIGTLTNEEYHYGSKKYEDDGSKKKVIYHLPTIQKFEKADSQSRESKNELVQGIDWPRKIKHSHQCLFAVDVSHLQKYTETENIEELAKTIKHLPYNEEGNIDFTKLKIVFVSTDAAYKHKNNQEKLEIYLQDWCHKIQEQMKKHDNHIIPDECFVVLNDKDNPLHEYKTKFDVSVDQLLEAGNPHVKKDFDISPFAYSEEKHKNAAFIISRASYYTGLFLNNIQLSHNNDTLYDDKIPDNIGIKTGEAYHYGQEKYEENKTGNVKKVVYHLPPIELFEEKESEITENSASLHQGIDWTKKIKNSSQCLYVVNISPGQKYHDNIETLLKLIENLPLKQDGSIDFSKFKIVFLQTDAVYQFYDNDQESVEKTLQKFCCQTQKDIQERCNQHIPDECFVVLNGQDNPVNEFKTSFDVSVDQLLGND